MQGNSEIAQLRAKRERGETLTAEEAQKLQNFEDSKNNNEPAANNSEEPATPAGQEGETVDQGQS